MHRNFSGYHIVSFMFWNAVKMLTISPYFHTLESPYFWFQKVGSHVLLMYLVCFCLSVLMLCIYVYVSMLMWSFAAFGCRVGLGICYDIRFAEMAQVYRQKGNCYAVILLSALLTEIIVKKTVVYHLVDGCTVLLHIENSKNDKLKVILLCSTLAFTQTATSNITFNQW